MNIEKDFSTEEKELFSLASDSEKAKILKRLENGELSPYVFGKKYFFKNYFKLNGDCLIPRPDTERVVEAALSLLKKENAKIADLCTGSGCIGLSILCEKKSAFAYLAEISENALEAAKENAWLLGCYDRTKFILCDLMKENPFGDERFDIIISNPPYLTTEEIDEYPLLKSEPRRAFDGGVDGLSFYRRFIRDFSNNLEEGGAFVFEIGYSQRQDIMRLSAEFGFMCRVTKDYGGNDRVAILFRQDKN